MFSQVASIRQHLATIYERVQSWREAAAVLVGIPLETAQKSVFHILSTRFRIWYIYVYIYCIFLNMFIAT